MEAILNNPGLQHLAENVLWNVDGRYLNICAQINQSCKQILENPMFLLKKFSSISNEIQKEWIKVIKLENNSEKRKAIISYLQWNLMKGTVDLQCYLNPSVQDDFRMKILESCKLEMISFSKKSTEIVRILAPLTDNPNAPNGKYGHTPIYWATLGVGRKLSKYWHL